MARWRPRGWTSGDRKSSSSPAARGGRCGSAGAGSELFFASTRQALEIVEATLRTSLTKRELDEGTVVAVEHGRISWTERFTPDRSYDERPLPAVRAPHEGASCLRRLAALAAVTF